MVKSKQTAASFNRHIKTIKPPTNACSRVRRLCPFMMLPDECTRHISTMNILVTGDVTSPRALNQNWASSNEYTYGA